MLNGAVVLTLFPSLWWEYHHGDVLLMCLDFPSCETNLLWGSEPEGLRSLAAGLFHILVPDGLAHQFEGLLASLGSWNCSTTYWFCWRNSSQQRQAMLFISCCHHNYFLRVGEMYSFLSLLAVAQRIKDKDYNGYVQAEELLIGIYPFKYV